jgi:hypothetical protein
MAVNPPTATQILLWTGINQYITGVSSTQLATDLKTLIPDGVVEAALAVGEDVWDSSSLTARQKAALTRAAGFRTARLYLQQPYVQKVTGTHEPHEFEESSDIAAVKAELLQEAERLESLATAGIEAVVEPSAFALPAFSSGTFDYSTDSGDRSPSERLDLQDERDDISELDTDNG